MTTKELMRLSDEELAKLREYFTLSGNSSAVMAIANVQEFGHKNVEIVKGRKYKHGTRGKVFWIGSTCHSPYGDPWGIYTTWRCGLKDEEGNVYWTSLDNVKVIEEEK